MNYWLLKSEPEVFSIDDLARERTAVWEGVRNYQARNFLRAMRAGDAAFFYHSSVVPTAIVGRMTIARTAYPEPTAKYSGWDQVDVRFEEKFERPLTLAEIKKVPELREMMLLRNSRLSVLPVTPKQWKAILKRVSFLITVAWLGAAPAYADCSYFLVKTRATSCKGVQVVPTPPNEAIASEDPLESVVERDDGRRVRLVCECLYSLSGSDPRCDFDWEEEIPQLLQEADPKTVCREAKKRCKTLCPAKYP